MIIVRVSTNENTKEYEVKTPKRHYLGHMIRNAQVGTEEFMWFETIEGNTLLVSPKMCSSVEIIELNDSHIK